MSEFNLSDKICLKGDYHLNSFSVREAGKGLFREKDVKEFIRLLKEAIPYEFPPLRTHYEFAKIIDKLAGEKLR